VAPNEFIRINVDGTATELQIKQLAVFLTDLRPFWPVVKRLVTGAGGWWSQQFATEGSFGGHGWAALSPRYAAIKATMFPGKPILQATGALRQAASNPRGEYTSRAMTLTIDNPVASYHQEGTDKMPARPIVFGDPLPAVAAVELHEAADTYVRDLLGRL
jgi:hypothetical protein